MILVSMVKDLVICTVANIQEAHKEARSSVESLGRLASVREVDNCGKAWKDGRINGCPVR
jgi:hypothetical protein